ncbi:type IV pilus assembly protein PilM [Candidatus Kaiserbacteria bacterium]|nr:type IV pilus assembly protein PilM [Candidatus Kaiserbacteria bacterium]
MAFSLGSISEAFSKITSSFSAKDSESVLGIDIGTSSIKVVQVRQVKGAAVLETYGEIALGPYGGAEIGQSANPPAEKVAEALTDVMKAANVSSKIAGFSVPLSGSLINVISLPTKDKSALATMIPIEARKYIPVPVSEVALDWFVIPEEEAGFLGPQGAPHNSNMTDVLLVAIHNQVLQKFESITKAAMIAPRFYEAEPFSMSRASYEHTTTPVMIIDLGASSTRAYVIEFGIIDVSHTVSRGSQDLTLALAKSQGVTFQEAENMKRDKGVTAADSGSAVLEFIFSEARRIYLTYQRKEGKVISQVVLIGGGAELKGVAGVAARYFDAPVSLGTPFNKVAAPAFIADVLKTTGPSFACAIGLSLRALQQ